MTAAGLLSSDTPLQEAYDVALVDLDGVTYKGRNEIPSAPPALAAARAAGMMLRFVTNNANRAPETVAEHLTEVGIPATADEILTAAQAGAALVATRVAAGSRVLVIGGDGLRAAVRAEGFEVVTSADDKPAAVVQGYAPGLGWADLAEAAYAINAGAVFIATNLDKTLPTERGFAPGNGSLVGAVQIATGVTPAAAGKPEPGMFLLAASRASAERPLVIGDRLDTDLKGARAAEIPGLLVLTGVNGAADAVAAPAGERPSFIGADLSTLAESHPAVVVAGQWRVVRDSRARVVDARLEIEGQGLDAVRAACAAAWEAADTGVMFTLEAAHIDGLL